MIQKKSNEEYPSWLSNVKRILLLGRDYPVENYIFLEFLSIYSIIYIIELLSLFSRELTSSGRIVTSNNKDESGNISSFVVCRLFSSLLTGFGTIIGSLI